MWLYNDCNMLNDDGRKTIVDFMLGRYTKDDVDTEEVILNREVNGNCTKDTVFKMLFKERKWKKIIRKKTKIHNK